MEEQKERERERGHRKKILPEQDQEQNLENSSEKRAASPAARSYAERRNEELRQRFLVRKVSSDRSLSLHLQEYSCSNYKKYENKSRYFP